MAYVTPPFCDEHEAGPDQNCVFASGIMQANANQPGRAPSTHAEVDALRAASGLGPTGPASSLNLIVGDTNRYHWKPAEIPRGFVSLWASLTPGHSATASGVPTDAPPGSPFRHWLPNYSGGHRVYVARMDDQDHVWLMDPEGPADGTYDGEWANSSDLAAFVKNGSTHTVAPIALEEDVDPVKAAPVASCDLAPTTGYLDDQGVTPTDPPLQGGQFDLYYRAGPGSSSTNMPNGAACLRGILRTGDDPSVLYADDAAISNVRLIGAPPPVVVPIKLSPGVYEVEGI